MAFIFTMRSAPRSSHRRDNSSAATSLPAIDEDNASFIAEGTKPPVPPRALNRPYGNGRHLGAGFGTGSAQGWFEGDGYSTSSPPAYSSDDGRVEKGGRKFDEWRKGLGQNKHISKRGGWRRLLLVLLLLLVLGIGLGVGLGVGLKKKSNGNSSTSNSAAADGSSTPSSGGASGNAQTPTSPLDTPANATFPEGSYSFQTYLSTVATNCTSNPATWMCYPYSTYAQSANASATTFDWIIRQSSPSKNYTISSTPNPFSILFQNAPLQLLRQGQDDEHYFFQLSMTKPTRPTQQLGSQNVAATCSFDNTTLQAYLYTKMPKTYPLGGQGGNGGFVPWPGAIKVEQVTGGTVGSPRCVDASGNSLGEFGVEDGTQLCDCLWLNTGT